MLTRLHAENFRSLKDLTLEFPQPLAVLVGPNNSGKSNIMEAIGFVGDLRDGGAQQLFNSRGRYRKVVFGGNETENITLELDGKVAETAFEYRVTFEDFTIFVETLVIGGGKKLITGKKGNGNYWNELQDDEDSYSLSNVQVALYQLNDLRRHKTIIQIANFISGFQTYDFVPSDMRNFSDVIRNLNPGRHGEELPAALHTIMSSDMDSFGLIREVIMDAIADVEDVGSPLTHDGRTYIAMKEKYFEKEFDNKQLSAGTLKFLAILSLLYSPKPPTLIGLEEPENYIHPWLLEMLVELIMKSGQQVIISTHSTQLVNHVPLKSLVIVEKKKGVTKAKSVDDRKQLQQSMEEAGFLLGELWYQGELGGVP